VFFYGAQCSISGNNSTIGNSSNTAVLVVIVVGLGAPLSRFLEGAP